MRKLIYSYIEGQIWELAKFRVVRNIQWTNIYKICQFLEQNFDFPNWKNSRNLWIFQIIKFWKFFNFPTCESSKNSRIGKFKKFPNLRKFKIAQFGKIQRCSIRKIPKIFNLKNSKILPIWKIPKISNSIHSSIFWVFK